MHVELCRTGHKFDALAVRIFGQLMRYKWRLFFSGKGYSLPLVPMRFLKPFLYASLFTAVLALGLWSQGVIDRLSLVQWAALYGLNLGVCMALK